MRQIALAGLRDVNLDVQISWQAQYYVDLEVQISWQVQYEQNSTPPELSRLLDL